MTTLTRSLPVLSRPSTSLFTPTQSLAPRCFHCSGRLWAVAHPITAHGPPPKAPVPEPEFGERVERRKKQAELIERGKGASTQPSKHSTALKKRFWKDVHVKKIPDGFQVLLDSRPVQTPAKSTLTIPPTKHHLAQAIALEWDLLTSAQQALKQHLIPLTSLTARADDIVQEDRNGQTKIRHDIVRTAMRYLNTDTLLCWVPEKRLHDPEPLDGVGAGKRETLRNMQMRVAQQIIDFLTQEIWPGIEIKPVLDTDSIMPSLQSDTTINVIRRWIMDLPAYELAALERGVLAGKSLLLAARLVVEWGEHFRPLRHHQAQYGRPKFGVEEAADASSIEVTYQTDMWGEVEDSHDVDREDLKRQLGSVVLLVSGTDK